MLKFPKRLATGMILVSFVMIAFFGFASMVHTAEGAMSNDCPLVGIGGSTLCPQDATAVVVHHISAYQTFLNIPQGSNAFASLIFAILAACVIFIFSSVEYEFASFVLNKCFFDIAPVVPSCFKQISRWLSLLENSPSLI